MARVLVADDDPLVCEMVMRICEFKGHETHHACDATDALHQVEAFHPDVVITDLAMPMGGGQRLLRELRRNPDTAALPVIVVSGYANALGAEDAAALAPYRVLAKPLELEKLLQALDAAVEEAQPSDV